MEEYKNAFYIITNIIIKQCVQHQNWLLKFRTGTLNLPTFDPFIIKINDIELFYLKKTVYENVVRSGNVPQRCDKAHL